MFWKLSARMCFRERHSVPSPGLYTKLTVCFIAFASALILQGTHGKVAVMHYGHFGGLSITCNRNELILMESEKLGHSNKPGECNPKPMCSVPYSLAQWYCRGKSTCAGMQVERRPLHRRTCGADFTNCLRVDYKCVKNSQLTNICGDAKFSATEGYMSSPNFPEMYPPDQNCSCSLMATDGGLVQLDMAFFLLKAGTPCDDWLSLNVDGRDTKKCGYIPAQKDFVGKHIVLNFNSDIRESEMGFWLKFKGTMDNPVTVRCGRHIYATEEPSTTTTLTTTSVKFSTEYGGSIPTTADNAVHPTSTVAPAHTKMVGTTKKNINKNNKVTFAAILTTMSKLVSDIVKPTLTPTRAGVQGAKEITILQRKDAISNIQSTNPTSNGTIKPSPIPETRKTNSNSKQKSYSFKEQYWKFGKDTGKKLGKFSRDPFLSFKQFVNSTLTRDPYLHYRHMKNFNSIQGIEILPPDNGKTPIIHAEVTPVPREETVHPNYANKDLLIEESPRSQIEIQLGGSINEGEVKEDKDIQELKQVTELENIIPTMPTPNNGPKVVQNTEATIKHHVHTVVPTLKPKPQTVRILNHNLFRNHPHSTPTHQQTTTTTAPVSSTGVPYTAAEDETIDDEEPLRSRNQLGRESEQVIGEDIVDFGDEESFYTGWDMLKAADTTPRPATAVSTSGGTWAGTPLPTVQPQPPLPASTLWSSWLHKDTPLPKNPTRKAPTWVAKWLTQVPPTWLQDWQQWRKKWKPYQKKRKDLKTIFQPTLEPVKSMFDHRDKDEVSIQPNLKLKNKINHKRPEGKEVTFQPEPTEIVSTTTTESKVTVNKYPWLLKDFSATKDPNKQAIFGKEWQGTEEMEETVTYQSTTQTTEGTQEAVTYLYETTQEPTTASWENDPPTTEEPWTADLEAASKYNEADVEDFGDMTTENYSVEPTVDFQISSTDTVHHVHAVIPLDSEQAHSHSYVTGQFQTADEHVSLVEEPEETTPEMQTTTSTTTTTTEPTPSPELVTMIWPRTHKQPYPTGVFRFPEFIRTTAIPYFTLHAVDPFRTRQTVAPTTATTTTRPYITRPKKKYQDSLWIPDNRQLHKINTWNPRNSPINSWNPKKSSINSWNQRKNPINSWNTRKSATNSWNPSKSLPSSWNPKKTYPWQYQKFNNNFHGKYPVTVKKAAAFKEIPWGHSTLEPESSPTMTESGVAVRSISNQAKPHGELPVTSNKEKVAVNKDIMWVLLVIAVIGWIIFMVMVGLLLYYRRDRLLCHRRSGVQAAESQQSIPRSIFLPPSGKGSPSSPQSLHHNPRSLLRNSHSPTSSSGHSRGRSTGDADGSIGVHFSEPETISESPRESPPDSSPEMYYSRHLSRPLPLPPAPPSPISMATQTSIGRDGSTQTRMGRNSCTQTDMNSYAQTDLSLGNPYDTLSKAMGTDIHKGSIDRSPKKEKRDKKKSKGQKSPKSGPSPILSINLLSTLSAREQEANDLNPSNVTSWALNNMPKGQGHPRPQPMRDLEVPVKDTPGPRKLKNHSVPSRSKKSQAHAIKLHSTVSSKSSKGGSVKQKPHAHIRRPSLSSLTGMSPNALIPGNASPESPMRQQDQTTLLIRPGGHNEHEQQSTKPSNFPSPPKTPSPRGQPNKFPPSKKSSPKEQSQCIPPPPPPPIPEGGLCSLRKQLPEPLYANHRRPFKTNQNQSRPPEESKSVHQKWKQWGGNSSTDDDDSIAVPPKLKDTQDSDSSNSSFRLKRLVPHQAFLFNDVVQPELRKILSQRRLPEGHEAVQV